MSTRHTINVENSEDIVAVHHEATGGDWIIFCHGFVSDKSGSYETRCERAVTEGYNAVRFDFRGSGESDGAFCDATLTTRITDLQAVIGYFDPPVYTLFGSSFGAKVALHTAVDNDHVQAVIGRAPVTYNRAFDTYKETAEANEAVQIHDNQSIDATFFDDFAQYPFQDVATTLSKPVAFFHGSDDMSVPIHDTLDAAASLQTEVLIQKYVDEGHRFSETAEVQMRDQFFDWLQYW